MGVFVHQLDTGQPMATGGLGLPAEAEWALSRPRWGSQRAKGRVSPACLACARFPAGSWREAAAWRRDRLLVVGSTSGLGRETGALEKAGQSSALMGSRSW